MRVAPVVAPVPSALPSSLARVTTPAPAAIRAALDARLPDLLDDLGRLVAVESPSNDLAAVARSADAVAALIRTRLGVEPERIAVNGVRMLRLRLGERAHDPANRVVLLAHHDTVWPLGTLTELPFTIDSGVIRGPGTFDMKLGLVVAVHALAALRELDAASVDGASLLVTGDEEVGSAASRALIEEEARGARAALVLEAAGPGGTIKVARKGTSDYRVLAHGRGAHAGLEPWAGVNASVEAAHVVLAVAALGGDDRATTVTPTVLAAGTTTNTVPELATVHVDVRAETIAEQQRVDAAIRALVPTLDGATLEVQGGINRPPMERALAEALFERASALAGPLGLAPLEAIAVGGASDGNFTAGIGTPTLDGLGAVGGGAHARHEHCLVEHVTPRAALVAALTASLLVD